MLSVSTCQTRLEFHDPIICPGVDDLIGDTHIVVSGSTVPAHLAAAPGIANVSLFDPRRRQLPVRWKPLGQGVILRPDVPTCEKCIYEARPYGDCLDRFSVGKVAEQVAGAVHGSSPLRVVYI